MFSQERPRPEFAAMAPSVEENPVTGVKEPYFPEKARLSRMFTGSMVIILMVRSHLQMFTFSIPLDKSVDTFFYFTCLLAVYITIHCRQSVILCYFYVMLF